MSLSDKSKLPKSTLSMEDQQGSGNNGEDPQQSLTKKNLDVPVNQSVSHLALMCCDVCLSKPQDDVDWRSYVAKYNVPVEVHHEIPHRQGHGSHNFQFPYEIGETVRVLKPSFRAPLGPYKVNRALADHRFELKEEESGAIHAEEVEARFLRRDPNAMS